MTARIEAARADGRAEDEAEAREALRLGQLFLDGHEVGLPVG
jgi:hypothetical protein